MSEEFTTRRIVEVEWEDSAGHHGWQSDGQIGDASLITSVGYVYKDDETGITVVEGFDPSPELPGTTTKRFGCATSIPRSAVRKVTELSRA